MKSKKLTHTLQVQAQAVYNIVRTSFIQSKVYAHTTYRCSRVYVLTNYLLLSVVRTSKSRPKFLNILKVSGVYLLLSELHLSSQTLNNRDKLQFLFILPWDGMPFILSLLEVSTFLVPMYLTTTMYLLHCWKLC